MSDFQDPLKSACMRERKFQDSKQHELSKVHKVLQDESLTADEKYVILTVELKFGKQRAQELCYGRRRNEWSK